MMKKRTSRGRWAAPIAAGLLLLLMSSTSPSLADEKGYTLQRTSAAHDALLSADPAAWQGVPAITWGPDRYRTTFQAVWTDKAIYARFDAVDPDPWHTMTKRDDHLWEEEVVELFIDPADQGFNYFELEINPANVVCDVRMLSAYPNVKSDLAWDHEGLETRVVPLVDGAGTTIGWTATAAIPFDGFRSLPVPEGVQMPPAAGDSWKFNVFRIKRPGGPKDPKTGALLEAWSKTGTPSFHTPSAFRAFTFR